MQKVIFFFGFVMSVLLVNAQKFNNEWIDYSKTYYKFSVGKTGLYRIPKTALASFNLQNTQAQDFQLWRNGKEIPIYTSIATGVLGNDDFIEFWGEQNDGIPDKDLYRKSEFQLSNKLSLISDTASYFLTVNAGGTNLRFNTYTNPANQSTFQSPELPNLPYTYTFNFKEIVNRGFALNVGENVYSSSYDEGEFLSTKEISLNNPYSLALPNLYAAVNSNATINASIAANSFKNRNAIVQLNGNTIINQTLSGFSAKVFTASNVNVSNLPTNSTIGIQIGTTDAFDRIVCGFLSIQYNRQFNFGGATNFEFILPPIGGNISLVIANFSSGNSVPVLYDLSNNRRFTAFKGNGDSLKFVLPTITDTAKMVLVNQEAANIQTVATLNVKQFINYNNATNQGNYIIISGKPLMNSGNALEQFRAYRSSVAGGSYNAKIVDIDELVDQFAFGIKKHPLSIKNFLRYAFASFASKPQYVFLVGKASTYDEMRFIANNPQAELLNLVPTWGWPASDALLVSAGLDPMPQCPVGRLSVITNAEIADYLAKIIAYEQQQASTTQTIANKAWMKQVVHVAGANDANLDAVLTSYLKGYERTITGPSFGGTVDNFNKGTTGATNAASNARMSQLFSDGISLITYFGHSAATTLDYNLNDPNAFSNSGKYPFFLVNGCSAGNFFDFDAARLSVITSLAEKFVLTPNKGTIGFLASTHFGLTSYLDTYSSAFYRSIDADGYGMTVGRNMFDASTALKNSSANFNDYLARLHAEQLILHGDPALKINYHTKPDFVVEEPQVQLSPSIISVADDAFDVKVMLYNIGKATGDSVSVLIKRQYPDGSTENVFAKKIASITYKDSLLLKIPIIPSRDKGNNALIVTVDNTNDYDELSESNNSITKNFVIFEDEIKPAYPYPFAIVNKPNVTFYASTANPLIAEKNYLIEVDTTALFNSPLKVTQTIASKGGVIGFTPTITFVDSTVYYWRVGQVPTSGTIRFNSASFIYLKNSSEGFSQSHVLQHTASQADRIVIDSISGGWSYKLHESLIQIVHSIFPTSGNEPSHFQISLNGLRVTASACVGNSVLFNLFDPVSLKPYFNQQQPAVIGVGSTYGGFMGSGSMCLQPGSQYNFEFDITDSSGRRKVKEFMDWIPNGIIVTARLIYNDGVTPLIDEWKKDETTYGIGNSAYSKLKQAGFVGIDEYNFPRTWAFVYKKSVPGFKPLYQLTNGLYDRIILNATILSPDTLGTITSPLFGPAKSWKQVVWKAIPSYITNENTLSVIGVASNGTETILQNVSNINEQADISSFDANLYPHIKLKLTTKDATNVTPLQLKYWRILYSPVPEGAVAPNVQIGIKDTLEAGEPLQVAVAFKNISNTAFQDSIGVKLSIVNQQNVVTNLPLFKVRKPNIGDTVLIKSTIDSKNFLGNNTLQVDVNPDNLQPEQFHFNNFLYKNIYVKSDNIKPVLDVTFDGVHILNNDIVSAKPAIRIQLKDESKFLALNDTSLVSVQLRLPNYSYKRYAFNSDTLRFTPAVQGQNNTALVDFTPYLTTDGNYELIVTGKDKSGNTSGTQEYRVSFNVYNKPMISNVFNYPNPFSTSTAFVFTLTGTQVPQQLKIQVLTVTGKIVKEITQDELGPIHIGNNITEYKWDGTDMFGAKLANGVYLYRIVTSLNGKQLDKFNGTDASGNKVDTDNYFKAGYGKMYLMR